MKDEKVSCRVLEALTSQPPADHRLGKNGSKRSLQAAPSEPTPSDGLQENHGMSAFVACSYHPAPDPCLQQNYGKKLELIHALSLYPPDLCFNLDRRFLPASQVAADHVASECSLNYLCTYPLLRVTTGCKARIIVSSFVKRSWNVFHWLAIEIEL
jgi:hypothetical protein